MGVSRGQKRTLSPELELKIVVTMWVLGIDPGP